jgi:D-alanyl-D-alanine-carboxypeptidase/D-alanyl-D-alanine-endopeptidase
MTPRLIRGIVVAALAVTPLGAQAPAGVITPTDAELHQILVDRIDVAHRSVGIVIGIITPAGRRLVAYGGREPGDRRPLDGDTVFEIGSVTKVFTGLLLADMVRRGEVALTDPIATYLPPGTRTPTRNGRAVTLVDLATHTSGLPRLPTNFHPKDDANPYADYTVADLYGFLGSFQLPRDIGSTFEYSNLGDGLLGHVLALRAGLDYETLVRTRITEPLALSSTAITLTPALRARLAPGHDVQLHPAGTWDFPSLPGAGALRSTANDLLTLLAAFLGDRPTPLGPAMAAMLTPRHGTDSADLAIGLSWLIRTAPPPVVIWHDGGTGGYRSFIGFCPKTHVGVVVLANAYTPEGVDDLGAHVLDPTIDARTAKELAPKVHKQVPVDTATFRGFVGRFQMAPDFVLTISRDGDHLFAQATGQSRFEIFPESPTDYFAKVADIQVSFVVDAEGRATSLIVHQAVGDTSAPRISGLAVLH